MTTPWQDELCETTIESMRHWLNMATLPDEDVRRLIAFHKLGHPDLEVDYDPLHCPFCSAYGASGGGSIPRTL